MAASNLRSSDTLKALHREIVVERVLDAPRELVFKAWTEPEHLAHWWGPRGFTLPACQMDFRPGGSFRFCMRSPDQRDHWCAGVYREIVAPERIVFTSNVCNELGVATLTTVTFAEYEGKTKITLHQTFADTPAGERVQQGWGETIDRLAAYLAAEPKEQPL